MDVTFILGFYSLKNLLTRLISTFQDKDPKELTYFLSPLLSPNLELEILDKELVRNYLSFQK